MHNLQKQPNLTTSIKIPTAWMHGMEW